MFQHFETASIELYYISMTRKTSFRHSLDSGGEDNNISQEPDKTN